MRYFIVFLLLISPKIFSQHYLDFYFTAKEVEGSIILYDENDDRWIFNDEFDARTATPPAATFHLFHALVALELDATQHYSPAAIWDGVKHYYFGEPKPHWQCHTTLDEAIFYQNDWYFEGLTKKIKTKDYRFFIESSQYTNSSLTNKQKYEWNFGEFLITPKEQVEFLIALFNQKLSFDRQNQQWIKTQLNQHQGSDYLLYSYEGYTVYQGQQTDWLIGVLERRGNRCFFCTRIKKDVPFVKPSYFKQIKHQITFEVFKSLGFL